MKKRRKKEEELLEDKKDEKVVGIGVKAGESDKSEEMTGYSNGGDQQSNAHEEITDNDADVEKRDELQNNKEHETRAPDTETDCKKNGNTILE